MKRETYLFSDGCWDKNLDSALDSKNTLIVCFGSSEFSFVAEALDDLAKVFSNSIIVGCSSAGEIYGEEVYEKTLSVAIMRFEKSNIELINLNLSDFSNSFDVGQNIANQFQKEKLKSIFVLSDGLNLNGSQLTKGLNSLLRDIVVTGGLAGDDTRFEKTWVLVDNKPQSNYLSAVGFYGDDLHIAYGSEGGWSKFGINRIVTHSVDNVLYRLDDKPALEIYKSYLGESSNDLPSSGLFYPLMIKEEGNTQTKVRTVLAVNEDEQSITFAGDIPKGSEVSFMRASFSELVVGASKSADDLNLKDYHNEDAINLAISCVGRKLVLGQRVEDELEAVVEKLSQNIKHIGYYSYGEISPLSDGKCDLHNQTMTLTLIWES